MPGIQWVLCSANPLLLQPISLSPLCLLGPDVPRCGTRALGALALLSPKVSLSQSFHRLTIPQLAVSLSFGWVLLILPRVQC